MTREDILKNQLTMASNELFSYSKNYIMDTPKDGYEDERKSAAQEVEMLEVWLKEFHRTNIESTVEYIGHIGGVSHKTTTEGKPFANILHFEVDTGAPYMYGDLRLFEVGTTAQHWFVGENSCCGKYDIEKGRRVSRLVKITVDHINVVRSIAWATEEVIAE